jgi:hypothetical protein
VLQGGGSGQPVVVEQRDGCAIAVGVGFLWYGPAYLRPSNACMAEDFISHSSGQPSRRDRGEAWYEEAAADECCFSSQHASRPGGG